MTLIAIGELREDISLCILNSYDFLLVCAEKTDNFRTT